MSEEMYFPPGEPTREEDPRQLLNEMWRLHDRSRDMAYGERYVSFQPLIERATKLNDAGWGSFVKLYEREHTRRRLTEATQLDWMERAAAHRRR